MLAYVTILNSDYNILPYFVEHYARLGATRFDVLVYDTTPARAHDAWAFAHAVVTKCKLPARCIGQFTTAEFWNRDTERDVFIRRIHPPGQWAWFADLDEFAELTPAIVKGIQHSDDWFAWGNWIDRIAPSGMLQPLDTSRTLDEQYPLTTTKPMSQVLGCGGPAFVMGKFAPENHHPTSCKVCRKNMHRGRCVAVHHFKWQANVLPRLIDRLAGIQAAATPEQPHTRWLGNVQRQIDHLTTHNGINRNLLRRANKVGI